MRKMNENEMRSVEGGYTASYTAKCAQCGKKFTVKKNYYVFFLKNYYVGAARNEAQDKAYACFMSHNF